MPDRNPIVIAHRGASGYLPEHTLAAKAVAHAMGADYLEQDVVLTADGVPIVLHDIYLDSTTDVAARFPDRFRDDDRFYAIDFTLAEIRQLRVRERSQRGEDGREVAVYPQRFPLGGGLFTLPTLEEEITLVEGLNRSSGRSAGLYLELKAPNWHRAEGQDIAARVMEVLVQTGYADRREDIYLQCFDPGTLQRLRQEFRTPLPLVQLIGENDWGEDTAADFKQMRTTEGIAHIASYADAIGPWLPHILTEDGAALTDLVPQAHARGLQVHPYTFRRDELPAGVSSWQTLLRRFVDEAAVDGMFTDFPDDVLRYLEQRGPGRKA